MVSSLLVECWIQGLAGRAQLEREDDGSREISHVGAHVWTGGAAPLPARQTSLRSVLRSDAGVAVGMLGADGARWVLVSASRLAATRLVDLGQDHLPQEQFQCACGECAPAELVPQGKGKHPESTLGVPCPSSPQAEEDAEIDFSTR